MTERMTVVGVFQNMRDAQAAIQDLKDAGFRDDEIGVVGPGDDRGLTHHGETSDEGTHAAEGAMAGAATGAGVGALWAIGIAAGMLPAIGPIVAGGILGSILASAAGGAAVAGLAGAMIGMGIPEEEARYYENEFRSGRTIVTVKSKTRLEDARRILGRHSGYDMESRPDRMIGSDRRVPAERSTTRRTDDVGDRQIELREEELHADKRTRNAGEARLRKEVVTEHKSIDVPVSREEVVIDRRPARGRKTTGGIGAGEEIHIPVTEEEVHVSKTPVVKEDVSIGKRKVTGTRRVDADVKHEELRVDEQGSARVENKGTTGRSRKTK